MKNFTKQLQIGALVLIFILLINWTTDFRFLRLYDLRLMIIMTLSTIILVIIGSDDIYQRLLIRFRFNLFLTSIIMMILLLIGNGTDDQSTFYQGIVVSVKPLLYGLIIYILGVNIIQRLESRHQTEPTPTENLTRREQEVFNLILEKKTNAAISDELYIAESTVKKHVQNILRKLNADNKDDIIKRFK